MANSGLKVSIASTSMAAVGVIFLYAAFYSDSRSVLYVVLFYLGLSLSSFAMALDPKVLLGKVHREGLQLRGSAFLGIAAVLSILAKAFIFLGCFGWVVSIVG